MLATFSFLAARRWAAVGLAVAVEVAVLLPLAYADATSVVGIPAAVATGIAGTVAVVFGPVDGALVAVVGAAVFGSAAGWAAGEVAALVVWPAVVVAAGMFGRRVARQRLALEEIVTAQETERRRIALELHDEAAQFLAAALMSLHEAAHAATAHEAGTASRTTRKLIEQTIRSLRRLAVELRPRVLDDFGLVAAVQGLAESFREQAGISVEVDDVSWRERLPPETETTAYRAVQEALVYVSGKTGARHVRITIDGARDTLRVAIVHDGRRERGTPPELAGLRERLRLVGGRLAAASDNAGGGYRLDVPVAAHPPGERGG